MLSTALKALPPRPGPFGFSYIPDMLYQVAMTGELQHSLIPTNPIAKLWRDWHVRWLVADRLAGPVDEVMLDRLVDRRYTDPEVTVWQLRQPR